MNQHVGIVGATGAIGATVAAALAAEGASFETIARTSGSRTWNPEEPATVRAAFQGLDTLVYCVGVDYTKFGLHPKVMRATIEGAVAAGVKRILLIGTVYAYGRPQSLPIREDHPRAPHTYKGRMRKEQEDLVLQAHADGRIEGAVLRLPDFYGPGTDKSLLSGAFTAAANGGTAQVIGPIDRPHQYVFIPDVGPLVARVIREPRIWGKGWHFAGSGTIVTRALLEKIFAAAGRPMKLQVANKLMLQAVGLFNPMMRELAEMHYLVTDPVVMDDSALRALLGDVHATPYDEGVRLTLEALTMKPASA
ncbi:MAG TPA: NAD-dependent epimerase/dehydratase family protein [Candidatus Baltobacteraceae bacterium]|jgi:nucleoside-diphosphate-sugar epimerase|nr:NAD-dependent epimerase/dehydratase family protein [Candidatus Baltobacteraceae bacterium]